MAHVIDEDRKEKKNTQVFSCKPHVFLPCLKQRGRCIYDVVAGGFLQLGNQEHHCSQKEQ